MTTGNGLIRLALAAGAVLLTAACGAQAFPHASGPPAAQPTPIPATPLAATGALPCTAWVTRPHPPDHTKVGIQVATAANAWVTTAAHYRTTVTKKRRQAHGDGERTNWYDIGGATPGFKVIVKVRVSRNGRTGHCRTSFTPRGAAPGPTPSPSPTPSPGLSCTASMSNSSPAQYTTDDVDVTTSPGAGVTATAHYKTTDTTHNGTAGSSGDATIPFSISGATIGFTVDVDVTVSLDGKSANCSTSFTPTG